MRIVPVLVLCAAILAGQDPRPAGLLPGNAPLAPAQEALLRGEAEDARRALDALLATAPEAELARLGPDIALLRAACEPVGTRAEAMLAVAHAYANGPIVEAASVAGLAALLGDGPEVGDLSVPLLGAGARPPPPAEAAAAPFGARREALIDAFIEVLTARTAARDCDRAAIDHARRLLGHFSSSLHDWVWVRPGGPLPFPARLESETRVRFYEIPARDGLPDPSHKILPEGPPRIDITLPAGTDGLTLPALEPGAWLAVVSGTDWRAAWPVIVTDLEVIAHSIAGGADILALRGGVPVEGAAIVFGSDPRFGSRTRSADRAPHNVLLVRADADVAIAPIASWIPAPRPTQRTFADLWSPQPAWRRGSVARVRLVARPAAEFPARIVFWPRQPCEFVVERAVAGCTSIDVLIPQTAPLGDVRAQVFDLGAPGSDDLARQPIVDCVVFTVPAQATEPAQILVDAPRTWTRSRGDPRVRLIATTADGALLGGLEVAVTLAVDDISEDFRVGLDADARATFVLPLGTLLRATTRSSDVRINARLLARDTEVARGAATIRVARTQAFDGRALHAIVRTQRPVAGKPVELALTGPPGEVVFITTADTAGVRSQHVTLAADGRADVILPTDAASWPLLDVLCATRALPAGRPDYHCTIALARPDPPSITIASVARDGDTATVRFLVESRHPEGATLSVAVADDLTLDLMDAETHDPEVLLRPHAAQPPERAVSGSPAPMAGATWWYAVLGRDDTLGAREAPRAFLSRPPRDSVTQPPGFSLPRAARGSLEATAALEPDVPIDPRGLATVVVRIPDRTRTWRLTAIVIDAAGGSAVKTTTFKADAVAPPTTPGPGAAGDAIERVTVARAWAETEADVAHVEPPVIPGALSATLQTRTFGTPYAVADALDEQVRAADYPAADLLAARIIAGVDVAESIVALRGVMTFGGYAQSPDGPTDYEALPLVLHALSRAAENGDALSETDVVPRPRDGFLRVAAQVLHKADGNAQAAIEFEDMLRDQAFRNAVPAHRRATLLVETTAALLALDARDAFARLGLASLVRRSQDLSPGLLARVGRALSLAGDTESAALALERLDAAPTPPAGFGPLESEAATFAAVIDLRCLLGAPPPAGWVADRARALTGGASWPRVTDAAFTSAALRRHHAAFLTAPSAESRDPFPPGLCLARRVHRFAGPDAPGFGAVVPERSLTWLDDGIGRIDIAADLTHDRAWIIDCPIPPGTWLLSASNVEVSRLNGRRATGGPGRVRWSVPRGESGAAATPARIMVHAHVVAASPVRQTPWAPCRILDQDTAEVLGTGATVAVDVDPPARPPAEAAQPASDAAVARIAGRMRADPPESDSRATEPARPALEPAAVAAAMENARGLEFRQHFATLAARPGPESDRLWEAWRDVLDLLAARLRAGDVSEALLEFAQEFTDPPARRYAFKTAAQAAFEARRALVRGLLFDRVMKRIEAGDVTLRLDDAWLAGDHDVDCVPTAVGLLAAALDGRHGDDAARAGASLLGRRAGRYASPHPFAASLAAFAASGPPAWRLPAVLALAPADRARLPLVVLASILRDQTVQSEVLDILLARDDAADLLRAALDGPLGRKDARRIVARLHEMERRPFAATPLATILSLVSDLEPQAARLIEAELPHRAAESPADLAEALASADNERARDALVRALASVAYTDVPWRGMTVGAERAQAKLHALLGDEDAADRVRAWMAEAVAEPPSQGTTEAVVEELWPCLIRHATPYDLLAFGAPPTPDGLVARAASWSDETIRDFLTSPAAAPMPEDATPRLGSVSLVVAAIDPARVDAFEPELLGLWRAYVAAGQAFDALSLFGEMGRAQIPAMADVLSSRAEPDQLAYVAALRRDVATQRGVAPLLKASPSDEIAKAYARYELEVLGRWSPPALAATRPSEAPGPTTPQDWLRVLTTRLRLEGLATIATAEPPVRAAWEEALRERGLLAR